jgi:hypothetical protein
MRAKVLVITMGMMLVSLRCWSQGTILFCNQGPGLSALVLDVDGKPVAPNPDYRATLYAGFTDGSATEVATTSFTSPGVFGEGQPPVALEFFPSTTPFVYLQVKTWSTMGGHYTSWDQATGGAAGIPGQSSGFLFQARLGDPLAVPPVEPSPLYGLTSFNFWGPPIPEPSTYALMAMGLGCLGWMGWRKGRS